MRTVKTMSFFISLACAMALAASPVSAAEERSAAEAPTLRERIETGVRAINTKVDEVRSNTMQQQEPPRERGVRQNTEGTPRTVETAPARISPQTQTGLRTQTGAQTREERARTLEEAAEKRIRAYVARMARRFVSAIEHLETLAERMDSRIEKLEERGLDLSQARRLLSEAQVNLEGARRDVAGIDAAQDVALSGKTPREAFGSVRALLANAKDSITAAHRALVLALREIKAGAGVRTTPPETGAAGETR